MPSIERHSPGSFAWLELATTDQAAAKEFYSGLFGWGSRDSPIGSDEFYTMFSLDERQTGAAFRMSAAEQGSGIPPHWQLYVAVSSADAAESRCRELGGRIIHGAFDVMKFGRMAVLQDPTGAVLSVWQAREHGGLGVTSEPGALCWADLLTRDRAAAMRFYSALFRWEFSMGRGIDPQGYLHILNGERLIGGLPPEGSLPEGVPPHWLPYIQVAECGSHMKKALALGARVIVASTPLEGSGHYCLLADPQGAIFALFAPGG